MPRRTGSCCGTPTAAWRSRSGDTLTLADYERTGGVEGAVADSAPRAYENLTPAQQAEARQVFTRLTVTTDEGVDTADRSALVDLTAGKTAAQVREVEAVLEAFAAERLLVLAAGSVEVSHEVLLTARPLLRHTWLAETHADRIVHTRLRNTAAAWARASGDPSYLYSGSLLQAADETAVRIAADPARHLPLGQTERDFLRASDRAHHRRVRRRHSVIAFLMVLVIGFASAAWWAFRASQDAGRHRDIAIARYLISQSEALGDTNPTISQLESVAAWRIHPPPPTPATPCWPPPHAPASPSSPATPGRSTRSCSARMARSWPSTATTGRRGCGTWPTVARSGPRQVSRSPQER